MLRRYPNRRLYDTKTRAYVALEAVAKWLEHGEVIKIVEQRTDRDITAETLAPLIAATVVHALYSHSPFEIAEFLRTIRDGSFSNFLTATPESVPVSAPSQDDPPSLDARVTALEHAVAQLLNRSQTQPTESNKR